MQAYLDYAATTPIKPAAIQAWVEAASILGNPSGAHKAARVAKDALEEARENVASLLGVQVRQIVFTSGGTESDNTAIFGSAAGNSLVLCSAIEHHAVLDPVERLGGCLIGVTSGGVLDLTQLEDTLKAHGDSVGLISIMAVNNETGVIQPLSAVSRLAKRYAPSALLHTDAVQAPNYLDVSTLTSEFDLVSLSGHKFGGPKGTGILVAKNPERIRPLILGGGQEWELRSGTPNLAGIISMAAALRDAVENRESNVRHVSALTEILRSGLSDKFKNVQVNGGGEIQMCNISNYCFEGLNSEEILFLLDAAGVYASAGSSCASGALNPSHVLLAMGKSRTAAKGSLRISLGPETTESEVTYAVDVIGSVITDLASKKGLGCI